jgi:hypothetical protein
MTSESKKTIWLGIGAFVCMLVIFSPKQPPRPADRQVIGGAQNTARQSRADQSTHNIWEDMENARKGDEASANVKALERQRERAELQSKMDRAEQEIEQHRLEYERERIRLDADLKRAEYGARVEQRKLDAILGR